MRHTEDSTHATSSALPGAGPVRWTLVPPHGSAPERAPWRPSPEQEEIAGLPAGCGPRLVLGGPGTGRTRVLVELAARRIGGGLDPDRLLVLTPSRLSAARLRDDLTAAVSATMSSPPVRAWQSYAFDLLRRAQNQGLLPGVVHGPKLLSGPEQDVLIGELMAGHAAGFGAPVVWPPDLREALATRGFRQEVRELFDRMSEYDLAPDDLRRLARRLERPDWAAAATMQAEYQAVRRLRMPESYDPAALVTEAARVLEEQPEFLRAEQERLDLVLVDDLHEATPSIHRLLAVLCRGRDTVLTACTDTVVQGFRGARPDLLRTLEDRLAEPARPLRRHPLGTSRRMPGAVAEVWQRVAERIPAVAGARHPRALRPAENTPGAADTGHVATAPVDVAVDVPEDGAGDRAAPGEVTTVVLSSPLHEARWIAHQVLERHLVHGVPLADMAVVVRNGRYLEGLERQLSALGVPVSTSAAETPVRDEPAVRPLLGALRIVTEAAAAAADREEDAHFGALTVQAAVDLLSSRIGNASPMDVRRLRQRLRAEELAAGGLRTSDDLLVEALVAPGALDAAGVRSVPARRIARMLAAGTRALREEGATAETVLWSLWEAAGVAESWRRRALEGGPAGERADRDLDAVVGLFESAERYVDHLPGAGPAQFLDYIDNQELPMDTLAARAPTDETVEIMTPATAAGRQWPVVFVAGVQEGVWPNTRLRGQLLGADLLTDALDLGVDQAARVTPVTRMREVRHDELRSFSAAVSRSCGTLVVTAASGEDEQPSEFLDLVDPPGSRPGDGARAVVDAPRPMTLRALVAELRQWVQLHEEDPVRSEAAARLLHRIASSPRPVPGAHPDTWWGAAALSSTAPVFDDGVPVPVSPSRIETIHRSPLDWFVAASRAEAATDLSRSLGSLVHAIAEELPEASGSELVAELERRWPTLGLPDTWESAVQLERARQMLRKFAQYVLDARSKHGRRLASVEGAFSVLVQGRARDALLRGRVDRLELDEQGRYVVVDLKTGRNQPAGAKIAEHPQLAAYQVALTAGAGTAMVAGQDETVLELPGGTVTELSGGALLVQLGTRAKSPSVQQQDPLDPDATWARDLITRAAELVAGERFTARHDQAEGAFNGHGCKLPQICPLCAEGRQVSEP
ncbi:ATP-dependent helicase [Kocuria rosea]|uniref:DNA 3'-5' helicase n=1 Tax=Kocuria rosea TaxID=1275 RepID=A0A4R5Y4Y5_KOCRO|nr:ATP-dependent DNA helicase [Kocuria rosea]TDL39534.1 ATP-dependent helicase [Kocuria rosea]